MKKNIIYYEGAVFGNWQLLKLLSVNRTNRRWLIKNIKTHEEKPMFQSNLPKLIVNEMNKLARQIKKHWPGFITEVNSRIKQGGSFGGYSLKEYFEDTQTQEKTKFLSPFISKVFFNYFKDKVGIEKQDVKGSDLLWLSFDIEQKLSLAHNTKSWTGNGFKKVGFHILMKFNMDEAQDFMIKESFICMIHLDICKSSWTNRDKTSNFSTLNLKKEDYGKIIVAHGDLKPCRTKLEKNLSPILKPV